MDILDLIKIKWSRDMTFILKNSNFDIESIMMSSLSWLVFLYLFKIFERTFEKMISFPSIDDESHNFSFRYINIDSIKKSLYQINWSLWRIVFYIKTSSYERFKFDTENYDIHNVIVFFPKIISWIKYIYIYIYIECELHYLTNVFFYISK